MAQGLKQTAETTRYRHVSLTCHCTRHDHGLFRYLGWGGGGGEIGGGGGGGGEGRGGGPRPPPPPTGLPTTKITRKNAACRSTIPQYRRMSNSTAD